MSKFLFRQAKTSDIDFLIDFQIQMASETEKIALKKETVNRGVESVFENPLLGQYYVLQNTVSAELVGCLLVTYEWSDWRNGTIWWIQSVYIHPSHRKQGAFSFLYRSLQNLCMADQNARGLRLYVEKNNSTAQKIYEKLGMESNRYQVCEWLKNKD